MFKTLDMYMRTSTIAQFENRLLHLKIIEDQMNTVKLPRVAAVLFYIRKYYSQFIDFLRDEMKQLEETHTEKI